MNARLFLVLGLAASVVLGEPPSRYQQIDPRDLKGIIEAHPVAFVPAGIVEWHGEQSACGLDALKTEKLAQMAAELLGGVSFPQVWLGPDGSTPFDPAKYPRGTVTIDKRLYETAAEQLLTDIQALGFRVAVYLSGHYPGVVPKVAERFNQRGGMKVISVSENHVVEGLPAGDHAAAWETSVLMVLRPGLVDLGKLASLPLTTRAAGDVIPPPYEFHPLYGLYGIYGLDPRIWSNERYGRKGVEAVMDGLARKVGRALGDTAYGRERPGFEWPRYDRRNTDICYDHMLPSEWMRRFEQTPIVYLPLAPADNSIETTTARAMGWARRHGGMVFPAISYAPSKSSDRPAMAGDVYNAVVSEVVADLADMDFRVVVLVTSPALADDLRPALASVTLPDRQCRLVIAEAAQEPGEELDAAVTAMLPNSAPVRELEGPWRINGRHTINSLAEDLYGSGDSRVYEHEFECDSDDAGGSALLDLGDAQNHCELVVNDGPVLTDHWRPYRFIITGMLHPGANRLKITVKHRPQATLDGWFYRMAPPRLNGPVRLQCWQARD